MQVYGQPKIRKQKEKTRYDVFQLYCYWVKYKNFNFKIMNTVFYAYLEDVLSQL